MVFRGFLRSFFPGVLLSMPSDFKVGRRFAVISCDKSVRIAIRGIPSYRTLVLRAFSAEIFLVNCFDKLSEFASIRIVNQYD